MIDEDGSEKSELTPHVVSPKSVPGFAQGERFVLIFSNFPQSKSCHQRTFRVTSSHSKVKMPARNFHLTFNGYWREPNKAGIPAEAGIFCVYFSTFSPAEKIVNHHDMVFIGSAKNARKEIPEHDLWNAWQSGASVKDQQICFNFAPADAADLNLLK